VVPRREKERQFLSVRGAPPKSSRFPRFLPSCASSLFTSMFTFLSHALIFLFFSPNDSPTETAERLGRNVSSQPLFAGLRRILCAQRLNAARFFAMFLFGPKI